MEKDLWSDFIGEGDPRPGDERAILRKLRSTDCAPMMTRNGAARNLGGQTQSRLLILSAISGITQQSTRHRNTPDPIPCVSFSYLARHLTHRT